MQNQIISMDVTLDALRRAQFAMMDVLRRTQGNALGAFGLSPTECPYQIVASGQHWRLRDYAERETPRHFYHYLLSRRPSNGHTLDLAPSSSAIRYCLRERLHVFLLEWLPASRHSGNNGLVEYAQAISECVVKVSNETQGTKPFLIGHSLGGTLAAIYSALASESVRGLVLLGAPLCFQADTNHFRDALVSLVPSDFSEADPFPGSLLSHASALASPNTFIWSRLRDAILSMNDHHALEIHARIERWALDEVPLPGKLVHQIIEWLYRENRFCRGDLTLGGSLIGPSSISVPTLAVVNVADDVAPLVSIAPFADAMPTGKMHILEYSGEAGVCLQHLGILIGREAQAQVWPQIIFWLNICG